jgi:hypothetical protein
MPARHLIRKEVLPVAQQRRARRSHIDVHLSVGDAIHLGEAGTLTVLAIEGDLILLGLEAPGEERPRDDEEEERTLLRRRRGRA